MDAHKAPQDIKVRNVTLHRRGRPDKGTLYLARHHLIFSYVPSDPPEKAHPTGSAHDSQSRVASGQYAPTATTEVSDLTNDSVESAQSQSSTDAAPPSSTDEPSARVASSKHKPRPKEVYVPYPLIHHCSLRPSHAQSGHRPPVPESVPRKEDDDDEMFPPTYGSGSYPRPSTDSTNLVPHSSPRRAASPANAEGRLGAVTSGRPPAIRIKCKDFVIFALHFHASAGDTTPDEAARQVFYALRGRCCVSSIEDTYAFRFKPPAQETAAGGQAYDARREFARMGIGGKAAEGGPGAAWRITEINRDYAYSATYPSVLCVPRAVSDNILKYSGGFRSKSRIPALAYLHSNGGSITRSSQPLVGVQGRRNPQDEKLVSAIFSSATPKAEPSDESTSESSILTSPSTATLENEDSFDADAPGIDVPDLQQLAVDDDAAADRASQTVRKRVYGSTRRNLIVDARPRINMIANKAAGGGIEDIANYAGGGGETPVEKVFLNIANIHAMRSSLDKVVDSLGNSDYLDLPPNQEALRKSGWLAHVANTLDGAEMVARVVGLGGSHALVHCSDGWDRTAQVSALAQVMLDPHCRTLRGFIGLVQKDFLSFGHKFRHRQGVEGSERWFEVENERIQPARARDGGSGPEANNLQAIGSKALSGARSWLEKNRGSLFRQQGGGGALGGSGIANRDGPADGSPRPATPPPNPILHSLPSPSTKEEKRKMDDKEVAPIFHQFLDAVYQLLYRSPSAFEFNERFLRRLLYQSYSGQYGEFLFNSEKERRQHEDRTASVWGYFLARVPEFTNAEYVSRADDPLLFPKRRGYEGEVEVRWWHLLFGRRDEEMNVPRALAPPDTPTLSQQLSSVSLEEGAPAGVADALRAESGRGVKVAKSTTALSTLGESAAAAEVDGDGASIAGLSGFSSEHSTPSATPTKAAVARPSGHEAARSTAALERAATGRRRGDPSTVGGEMAPWEREGGDPLGVGSSESQSSQVDQRELEWSAFAQQNAFSERR